MSTREDTAESPPSAGELRFLSGEGERNLVLVLAVRATHLIYALAHPYTEYATGSDIVVSRDAAGSRYAVVICCDCIGTALLDQSDPLPRGTVPDVVLTAARRFDPRLLPEGTSWWTGPCMTGPLDARWDLKAELRATTAKLSAERLAMLLEEPPP